MRLSNNPIVVRPTLIVGLGGTGVLVCQWAEHYIRELFGYVPSFIRFLKLDTDAADEGGLLWNDPDVGIHWPIAMEGALKLKEISYIHAEGYAAGEMKHGPIALIDPAVPVIAIAPSGPLFEKTASNLQEAAARGGQLAEKTSPVEPSMTASYWLPP